MLGREQRESRGKTVEYDGLDVELQPLHGSDGILQPIEITVHNVHVHLDPSAQHANRISNAVLAIDEKEVLVDVGFKSEGVIPLVEFSDPGSIKVGDVLDVFLEKMENQDGLVVLSKQRADFVRVWDRVKEAHDSGQVVEGRLMRKIKGGVVVDLYGVEAFLPGSQIALRQV